jgi:hypothetical protein
VIKLPLRLRTDATLPTAPARAHVSSLRLASHLDPGALQAAHLAANVEGSRLCLLLNVLHGLLHPDMNIDLGVPAHLSAHAVSWSGLSEAPVSRETATGNYNEARRLQHDAKTLSVDGDLLPTWTPLENEPVPLFPSDLRGREGGELTRSAAERSRELKPHLGAAISSYLTSMFYLTLGLWAAALCALPALSACSTGGAPSSPTTSPTTSPTAHTTHTHTHTHALPHPSVGRSTRRRTRTAGRRVTDHPPRRSPAVSPHCTVAWPVPHACACSRDAM